MSYAAVDAGSVLETEFRVGKVVSTSLSIFLRNIVSFTVIAGMAVLPAVGLGLAMRYGVLIIWNRWLYFAITLPLTLILMALTTAIILHATFQHMRGRPVRLTEAISRGLSRSLILLGLMLLQSVAIAAGLLLIVPGILLLAMWFVAVPICVVENTGPTQSLKRSTALTKGLRWKIFALLLLSYGVSVLGGELLSWTTTNAFDSYSVRLVAEAIWQSLNGGFGSVLITVAYYYLRVTKEGVDVEQIAAVFD